MCNIPNQKELSVYLRITLDFWRDLDELGKSFVIVWTKKRREGGNQCGEGVDHIRHEDKNIYN